MMNLGRAALILALALGGHSTPTFGDDRARTSDVIPVTIFAGVDQATIGQRLEQPSNCEKVKQGNKCIYKGGAVEIAFIGGLADWFTVYPNNAPFIASSLTYLGLSPDQRANFANENIMRWTGINGLREVSAFPDASARVSYFYVKSRTP